jgi:hypothetical protein
MGRACSTNGVERKCIQEIGGKARDHCEDQDVDGLII